MKHPQPHTSLRVVCTPNLDLLYSHEHIPDGNAFLRNWSGRRDSNPQPSAWEADALPLRYTRSGWREINSTDLNTLSVKIVPQNILPTVLGFEDELDHLAHCAAPPTSFSHVVSGGAGFSGCVGNREGQA